MTTYKELRMIANAGNELRNKIQRELSAHPETSGGKINCIDIDPDTGDLLITAQYTGGQRVQRIVIKDEGPGPFVPLTEEEIVERLAGDPQTGPGEAWVTGKLPSEDYFRMARNSVR